MTQKKIHNLYRLIAYFIIGLSLILILAPIRVLPIQERFSSVFALNIGFHMFYHLISIVPLKQLNWMKGSLITQNLLTKIFIVISYSIIFICSLGSIAIIRLALLNNDFYQLLSLLVLLGVVLGAYKLNLKLRHLKWTHYNNV